VTLLEQMAAVDLARSLLWQRGWYEASVHVLDGANPSDTKVLHSGAQLADLQRQADVLTHVLQECALRQGPSDAQHSTKLQGSPSITSKGSNNKLGTKASRDKTTNQNRGFKLDALNAKPQSRKAGSLSRRKQQALDKIRRERPDTHQAMGERDTYFEKLLAERQAASLLRKNAAARDAVVQNFLRRAMSFLSLAERGIKGKPCQRPRARSRSRGTSHPEEDLLARRYFFDAFFLPGGAARSGNHPGRYWWWPRQRQQQTRNAPSWQRRGQDPERAGHIGTAQIQGGDESPTAKWKGKVKTRARRELTFDRGHFAPYESGP